jgi:hypothetical protein
VQFSLLWASGRQLDVTLSALKASTTGGPEMKTKQCSWGDRLTAIENTPLHKLTRGSAATTARTTPLALVDKQHPPALFSRL